MKEKIAYFKHLDGCRVVSKRFTEPFLDTDNELTAHTVLGVNGNYAQQENLKISG